MSFDTSSNQKKSLLISSLLFGGLLLILFFIRFWPPANLEELIEGGGGGGVSINFGDSDFGSGVNFESEVLEVHNKAKQTPIKSTPEEAILSQENTSTETVVITQKEKKQQKPIVKEESKPVVEKPKVSNNTNEALSSILKGATKDGDGDDKTAGNKGKSNGSLSSNGYYGSGGSGGSGGGTGNGIGTGSGYGAGNGSGGSGNGSGYALGNRKAISKPAPKYTCNEQGKVVVEVSVDQNGKTIGVIAGIKGSTNTAKCLLDQATIAAMNTKWEPSSSAPEKQVGKIIYNFNLN